MLSIVLQVLWKQRKKYHDSLECAKQAKDRQHDKEHLMVGFIIALGSIECYLYVEYSETCQMTR